ncbi:hypothetical protein B4O97_11520 [Marispirochaeta aestuarii]|uniref:Cation efflux protein transmembrane domain-containing protein n=1 Tax=Marispirochaeta aestuarii TaxID=1963862 RepID=A0A1Y1RYJ8_9SPIO|nr:CDF family Co(II)/Ni(II) efflux transporter DmeF [Marispirochaeta aestuarii]ORC34954.1 hypothetical protein B4O97_11520 [Marispirochaeta aestuarii]
MNQRLCDQYRVPEGNHRNMRKTSVVVVLTLGTMVAEIVFGLITGSMSLLADGIHMGTHTFALLITLIAYVVAERNAGNQNFAFSSGKVGILGGYTNAIILGITALFMVVEAAERLINPKEISFNQALVIALIGLVVNLFSAFLLSAPHQGQEHGHQGHHHDHNLRAAYLHVITDAMTSVLAIIALLSGKIFSQTWPDAVVAILGALVILKWAYGLLVSSGKLLVDYYPVREDRASIMELASSYDITVQDLHIWKTSENDKAMVLKVRSEKGFDRNSFYNQALAACDCQHLTLEVE